jgi:hypothetical protein
VQNSWNIPFSLVFVIGVTLFDQPYKLQSSDYANSKNCPLASKHYSHQPRLKRTFYAIPSREETKFDNHRRQKREPFLNFLIIQQRTLY